MCSWSCNHITVTLLRYIKAFLFSISVLTLLCTVFSSISAGDVSSSVSEGEFPTFSRALTCVKLPPHTRRSVLWMPCVWLHPLILHRDTRARPIITKMLLLQFSGGYSVAQRQDVRRKQDIVLQERMETNKFKFRKKKQTKYQISRAQLLFTKCFIATKTTCSLLDCACPSGGCHDFSAHWLPVLMPAIHEALTRESPACRGSRLFKSQTYFLSPLRVISYIFSEDSLGSHIQGESADTWAAPHLRPESGMCKEKHSRERARKD